jgi:hypothetical protein
MSKRPKSKKPVWDRQLGKVTTYLLLVLFAVSPILCAMLAGLIAKLCGSQLDEGGVHPCIVCGVDIGGLLYKMGVLGWLSLFTVPIGFLCIVAVTREFLKGKKPSSEDDTPAFAVVRTVKSAVEADMFIAFLRSAGLHPSEVNISANFSFARAETEFSIEVPTKELRAARELLKGYENSASGA